MIHSLAVSVLVGRAFPSFEDPRHSADAVGLVQLLRYHLVESLAGDSRLDLRGSTPGFHVVLDLLGGCRVHPVLRRTVVRDGLLQLWVRGPGLRVSARSMRYVTRAGFLAWDALPAS